MSEYIPIEIQAEILKRLPLKPLIQFRSVSKPWKRLIDSPDFMISYAVLHPQPDRFILRYKPFSYYYHNNEDIYLFFVDNDDNDNNNNDNDNDNDNDGDDLIEDQYLFFVDNDGDGDGDDGDDDDDTDNDNHHHGFVQQDIVPTIPDLLKRIRSSSIVVGNSHGLVCFVGRDGDLSEFDGAIMVVLCNPSIRKSIGIQVPEMYDSPDEYYEEIANFIGFGVCPVTFDPTILIIQCIDSSQKLKGDMRGISVPWKVSIFTLSTGTWSILSSNLPRESIGLYIGLHEGSYQVVIDRFIYWLAKDRLVAEEGRSQSPFLIMSFDLTAKEFREINLTGCLTNRLCKIKTISKLRESLVLLGYHKEFKEDPSVCCLWMMTEEQGVSESFTKLYTFNLPDTTVNTLLGFRKTGALILETWHDCKYNAEVQIYEPNSEAIDYLEIDGVEHTFSMCSYRDSLLLVDQLDGFIYLISP